jgi:hypothetical protein
MCLSKSTLHTTWSRRITCHITSSRRSMSCTTSSRTPPPRPSSQRSSQRWARPSSSSPPSSSIKFAPQAEFEQWHIDIIPLSPYEDVKPSKRATWFQWLDEFSTLDPVGDLLTSKPRTAPKQLGDTSAQDIYRPFDFPTVFETHLEEVNTYNETAESFDESFDFPAPHPNSPAGSEAYTNGKALDNHYAPQDIIDNYNYDARWMETTKHNVFIDMWIPGRWSIRTESTYYISQ